MKKNQMGQSVDPEEMTIIEFITVNQLFMLL